MDIISYSEARANLNALMDRAVNDHVPIAISRYRAKPVVLVALDDWEELQATIKQRSALPDTATA